MHRRSHLDGERHKISGLSFTGRGQPLSLKPSHMTIKCFEVIQHHSYCWSTWKMSTSSPASRVNRSNDGVEVIHPLESISVNSLPTKSEKAAIPTLISGRQNFEQFQATHPKLEYAREPDETAQSPENCSDVIDEFKEFLLWDRDRRKSLFTFLRSEVAFWTKPEYTKIQALNSRLTQYVAELPDPYVTVWDFTPDGVTKLERKIPYSTFKEKVQECNFTILWISKP